VTLCHAGSIRYQPAPSLHRASGANRVMVVLHSDRLSTHMKTMEIMAQGY
jgi:hypothetical protein